MQISVDRSHDNLREQHKRIKVKSRGKRRGMQTSQFGGEFAQDRRACANTMEAVGWVLEAGMVTGSCEWNGWRGCKITQARRACVITMGAGCWVLGAGSWDGYRKLGDIF
jgi:hypothetical protein